ncbi:ABC transporter permease [Sideroxydans lithotrophicus]|uniref:Binding-protein-dependent transport systems inner membrane component n=1 Tax=Sideroxydans lithotrophicus (strain ES-1) TaxID=580332 RepID=D5CTC5_SIDLE|nr:ABC transporter permease [Sideroxydans lithotrophicus]ADE12211.1 binding-protein-dependent transport systems inner membrane component [Sideroxydans lithotrophicus ES-1]
MSFMPVFLWSDRLVFLLIAAGFASAWYIRRHEHLLLPWRRVGRSRIAMVSLVVLSFFLVVGLLDTLHFRVALPQTNGGERVYSPEVLSVFDKLVEPLRTHTEKTYSEPFALTLYAKESVTDEQGNILREYPRLKYGGAHLSDISMRDADVAKRALLGMLSGSLVGALMVLLARSWTSQRAVFVSIFVVAALVGAIANLAAVYHVLGTDKVGQDVLYLSLKSIRTGLIIGTVTTLVTLPLALFLGVAAGYFRGWVDDVIQYTYTVLSSIPSVLLIAAAVLMMQVTIDQHPEWFGTTASRADLRLVFLCLILGMTSWTGLCRLLRGETLKLREMEYIQAAQSFGVSSMRILVRHIMPNVMHIVLISLVLDFSALVLAEAVLSYVGVGVDPTMISFGTMINAARLEMGREPVVWWALASAFGFMLVLVLAANLFADAVRDAFDPRLNRTEGNP